MSGLINPEKWVQRRTDEIYMHPKNRFLRFFRRGCSREDATFVAGTQFLVETKNALGQGDLQSHRFASRIQNALSIRDIQRAIQQGIDEQRST